MTTSCNIATSHCTPHAQALSSLSFIERVIASGRRDEAEKVIYVHRSLEWLPPVRGSREFPARLLDLLNTSDARIKFDAWVKFSIRFLDLPVAKQQALIDVAAWRIMRRREKAVDKAALQFKKDKHRWYNKHSMNALVKAINEVF